MRLLHLLGWLVLVAGTAWLLRSPSVALPAPDTMALLAYPLDDELVFNLEPGEREVRVVTWLAHAPVWERDARIARPYSLRAEVDDRTDTPVWTKTWWLSSRDSDTSTRLADGGERLTEDRMTTLRLDGVADGRRLVLRPGEVPQGARLLLVAWRVAERPAAGQLRLLREDPGEWHTQVARRFGAAGWSDLPTAFQAAEAAVQWERLGALPEGGGIVPTERLLTRFARTPFQTDPHDGLPLPGGAGLAWNVVGPATWSATWLGAGGVPAHTEHARLRTIHADGRVEETELPAGTTLGPIEVQDALSSLQVLLPAGSTTRRLAARIVEGAAWGTPPVAEDGYTGPDLRRLELYRTRPGDGGLRFAIPADTDVYFTVRARLPAAARAGFAAPTGTTAGTAAVDALDANGAVLTSWSIPIAADASTFERPAGPDTPADAAVGEAAGAWIVPPAGTVALRAATDRVADVAIHARPRLPFTLGENAAYPRPEPLVARARFVPPAADLWTAAAPDGYPDLLATGRVVAIDAQVRLEVGDDGAAPATVRRWSSFPLAAATTVLAERGPGRTPRARLGTRPVRLAVDDSGRLPVTWRVDPRAAGSTVPLTIDGAASSHRLPTAAGSFVLDVAPGPHTVTGPSDGLFLARAETDDPWRFFHVAPLSPDHPLDVRLPRGEGGLSVQVYQAAGDSGSLEWTIEAPPVDPGAYPYLPRRHGEVVLSGNQGTALGISLPTEVVARDAALLWVPAPGATTLHLVLRDTPHAAWVRLTSTWPGRRDADPVNVVTAASPVE